MIRVRAMVVEDDPFTRSMIVSALQLLGIDVVLETGSASVANRSGQLLKPDIAILDLDLGSGPSGIDLALALRRKLKNIGIVLLTTFEDPRLHSPGLPSLPHGSIYLVKREISEIDSLFKAIKKSIIANESLPDKISNTLSSRTFADLTDSQIETMRLIAKGLTNVQIAAARGINEKSVEQTVSRLAKQLKIEPLAGGNQRVLISRLYFRLTGGRLEENEI